MKMKQIVLLFCGASVLVLSALAQERIYRCGNEYTNTVSPAQAKGCKLMEGGNVTVVQAPRPKAAASKSVGTSAGETNRVDAAEQKSRDSDARMILQSELSKSQARQAELLKEYNNGEPEKRGDEARNYQKYLDRVAELKASLARNESDIAGIQRELTRAPASNAAH
jgi:hypothetical protein